MSQLELVCTRVASCRRARSSARLDAVIRSRRKSRARRRYRSAIQVRRNAAVSESAHGHRRPKRLASPHVLQRDHAVSTRKRSLRVLDRERGSHRTTAQAAPMLAASTHRTQSPIRRPLLLGARVGEHAPTLKPHDCRAKSRRGTEHFSIPCFSGCGRRY